MKKKCYLCEEYYTKNNEEICSICNEQLKQHIGLKCITCGSIGFIDKNEKNIIRFQILVCDNFKELCENHKVTIISMKSCPNCIDTFTSGYIRSDLIH